jgi:hypothetical protein
LLKKKKEKKKKTKKEFQVDTESRGEVDRVEVV